MARAYFSPASFRFLRALEHHNAREWFQAHKEEYERHVREPFLDLIADLQQPLAKISPHFRADPRKVGGSLFRIHRDVRFSHNKLPYKTWAGARLFHERRREVPAPSFYIHIQPGDCFVGGGIWHPQSPTLKRLREFIADNPTSWSKAVHSTSFERHFSFWGEHLKRPPRGFDPEHPLIEDLKLKNYAAGADFDEDLACSDRLHGHLVTRLKALAPMIDYLCAALDLDF
jgi:uncharacterized protein (TIGR02453 family)